MKTVFFFSGIFVFDKRLLPEPINVKDHLTKVVEWHVKDLTAMLKQHNAFAFLGLHCGMIYLGKNVASEKDHMVAFVCVKLHCAHDSRIHLGNS